MKRPRTSPPQSSKPVAEFWGFRQDGTSFRSREPVDNAWTRAVWDIAKQIRERLLRPDETVFAIAQFPDFVRTVFHVPLECQFSSVLAQWSSLSLYREWPLAWVGSSPLSTLKYSAARVPLSSDLEPVWLETVRRAELLHAEPPLSAADPRRSLDEFVASLSEPQQATIRGFRKLALEPVQLGLTDEQIAAERERQIAAAKQAGLFDTP